jgi:hypothetical protein
MFQLLIASGNNNYTLLVLNSLGVIVALELTSLIMNMLCTLIFLGHYANLCFMLKKII